METLSINKSMPAQSADLNSSTITALRLFLCGPGGTGKTHVIRSVQEVMKFYGCEHQLRFLAPTGNAAALIDGTTCHKGTWIEDIIIRY